MAILDQAIQWYRSRPAEESTSAFHRAYAVTLYDARRWDEARTAFEELVREVPGESYVVMDSKARLGLIAAREGDRDKALQVSDWLKNLKQPYMFGSNTYRRAGIAAILGEKDQAVALLNESFLQGNTYDIGIRSDFDFESLWDYPPFEEILKPKE
jgi:predicted Zn-dependent protease